MISSIGLKNIRVFKNWTEFDLSPITILTGTNDSGKSALQKALILLSNGFERVKGGMCNFEKIQFSKEFLELTGDFAGNLSYGSKNQNLKFSFNFEDELFGPVKAVISYEKGIDILTARANRIVFKQNDIEFLCFKRYNKREHSSNESIRKSALPSNKETLEKDTDFKSDEESTWSLSPDLHFMRNLFLKEREDGRFLNKLQTIQDKYKRKEKLNDEELELWKRMKELKIDFYKTRRLPRASDTIPNELKEKRDKDRLFRLWNIKGKWSEIFLKFNSPFTEILFFTPLVKLVLGKEEILRGTKDPMLLPIYNALFENGIATKDDFLKAYIEFEIELINSIILRYKNENKIVENHDPISLKEYFLGELELSDNLTKKEILNKKFVKSSIIAQILDDNDLFPWYDNDKVLSKEFKDQILFIRESLFGLTKSLGNELNKLNDRIKFSLQNSTIKLLTASTNCHNNNRDLVQNLNIVMKRKAAPLFTTVILLSIVALFQTFLFTSCKKESEKEFPTITVSDVRDITSISAVAGGEVLSDGGAEITSRGVCWSSINNTPTIADSKTSDGTGLGIFTSLITGLTPGTTYYMRAYATNSAGTAYYSQSPFKTLALASEISTSAVSLNTSISFVTGGNIANDGGSFITAKGVCWSRIQNPTILDNKTFDGTGIGSFTSSILGLSPNTTYYFRAYASNSIGTAYGNQLTFTTLSEIPVLHTVAISALKTNAVISGGKILSDGGASNSESGVCWATTQNPTIADSRTKDTPINGNYVSSITGLVPNTLYYLRAYATNIVGTGYGNTLTFKTYAGTVTDIDGNNYNTVIIGTQEWMVENLKTTKYNNSDFIGTTIPAILDISAESKPKYQWAFDGNETNVAIYGRLYTGAAVADSRNLAPIGWHVPSVDEWSTLLKYLGGGSVAGGRLKEAGTVHWLSPNAGATNETGFSALPGGIRFNNTFINLGIAGYWWTSNSSPPNGGFGAIIFHMTNYGADASMPMTNSDLGYSVRCIKD